MDNLSKMDRSGTVSPTAGPLWQVHKKNRMGDDKERERKRLKREKKQAGQNPSTYEKSREEGSETKNPELEEEYGYGSNGTKKTVRQKIDLLI